MKALVLFIAANLLIFGDSNSDYLYHSTDKLLQFSCPTEMEQGKSEAITSIGVLDVETFKSIKSDSFGNVYNVIHYPLPVYLNMESDSMFVDMVNEILDAQLSYTDVKLDYLDCQKSLSGYLCKARVSYGDQLVMKYHAMTNGTHFSMGKVETPYYKSLNKEIDRFLEGMRLKMEGE